MRAVVAPPAPALLPQYASLDDPVPDLRAACRAAVAWLVAGAPATVAILADPPDRRVGEHLLAEAGFRGRCGTGDGDALLVLASGSACRSEQAPGHLDERSFAFDDTIDAAWRSGDLAALGGLDERLAADLLARGLSGLRVLAGQVPAGAPVVEYADDPFGVGYWVVRLELTRGVLGRAATVAR